MVMPTIEATFVNGIFKPIAPINLPEGTKVQISLVNIRARREQRMAALTRASQVAQVIDRRRNGKPISVDVPLLLDTLREEHDANIINSYRS